MKAEKNEETVKIEMTLQIATVGTIANMANAK
jgi:hypothetical protein